MQGFSHRHRLHDFSHSSDMILQQGTTITNYLSKIENITRHCTFETQLAGLLVLHVRNGAISHNQPQMAPIHTIHEKLHNSQKNAQYHKIKHKSTIFLGIHA